MYTRSFFPTENNLAVPQNYDGTAFDISPTEPEARIEIGKDTAKERKVSPQIEPSYREADEREPKIENISEEVSVGAIPKGFLSGILPHGLGGIFEKGFPSLGTEEILLVAVAAFLFFSKGGDRECALMLLLLIFIN